jgi:hypothetical protein
VRGVPLVEFETAAARVMRSMSFVPGFGIRSVNASHTGGATEI